MLYGQSMARQIDRSARFWSPANGLLAAANSRSDLIINFLTQRTGIRTVFHTVLYKAYAGCFDPWLCNSPCVFWSDSLLWRLVCPAQPFCSSGGSSKNPTDYCAPSLQYLSNESIRIFFWDIRFGNHPLPGPTFLSSFSDLDEGDSEFRLNEVHWMNVLHLPSVSF